MRISYAVFCLKKKNDVTHKLRSCTLTLNNSKPPFFSMCFQCSNDMDMNKVSLFGIVCFLIIRYPQQYPRTDTPFPYTSFFLCPFYLLWPFLVSTLPMAW